MKKILTVLFTLVLAISVIGFNTNGVKAEENGFGLKKGEYYVEPGSNIAKNDFQDALSEVSGNDVSKIKKIVFTTDTPVTTDVDFAVAEDKATGSFDSTTGTVTIKCGTNSIMFNDNSKKLFNKLPNLEVIDFGGIIGFNPSDINGMYELCPKLVEIKNFKSIDTSNVTDMGHLFNGCSSLNITIGSSTDNSGTNLKNYNTSNVTNMSEMFQGCAAIEELDFSKASNFNTSKVTDMSGMFNDCSSLETLNVSLFDTSKVKDMSRMFGRCHVLFDLVGLNNFNTSNVTNMWSMFSQDYSLSTLNISNWNTSKLANTKEMFNGCLSLVRIYVPTAGLDLSSVTGEDSSKHMFYGCVSLIGGNGTTYVYDEDKDPTLSDKTYAKVDKEGQKGYFTDVNSLATSGAALQADGTYKIGAKTVSGIRYDNSKKTLYLSGFNMDFNTKDPVIDFPKDMVAINVTGVNSIVNINDDAETFICENEKDITFNGNGKLTIAYLDKSSIILHDDYKITIDGPTINIYADLLKPGQTSTPLMVNQLIMKSGELTTNGVSGIILNESSSGTAPKLVIAGGKIKTYGTYAGLTVLGITKVPGAPDAVVKGSVTSLDELKALAKTDFKAITSNDAGFYTYYVDEYIARYLEITPNPPSPVDPTTGTDEMAYDTVKKSFVTEFEEGLEDITATAHISNATSTTYTIKVLEGTKELVKNTDYSISDVTADGSVKVTLKSSYLSSLTNGEHKLTISLTEGSNEYKFDVTITVDKKPEPIKPDPGKGEMDYDKDYGFVAEYNEGNKLTLTAHIEADYYSEIVTVYDGQEPLTEGTDYEVTDGSIKVTFKKEFLSKLSTGVHKFVIDLVNEETSRELSFNVTIKVNSASKPSPTKDESCEKVIGPTWHWNNKKGICEDTGVVKTYTR